MLCFEEAIVSDRNIVMIAFGYQSCFPVGKPAVHFVDFCQLLVRAISSIVVN